MLSHHRPLRDFPVLDVLQLIRSENVGPVTFFNLVSYYGSPAKALDALPELAKRGGRKKPLVAYDRGKAKAEIDAASTYGASFIVFGGEYYPKPLQHCHDAPPVLMALGDTSLLTKEKVLGVVGARNASANGCAFVKKIAEDLGKQGFVIASGLARGIDTAAHLGSISTGTIAVIAGGINNIYPPENERLFKDISETGVILAEAPFGTSPMARHFPARNRIIAGISQGLLVAEASQKSGSLITANYALDYGRDVFAMPGSPLDPRSAGANSLIKNGAMLVESSADILNNSRTDTLLKEAASEEYQSAPAPMPTASELEKMRITLKQKLGPEAVFLDELLAQCNTSPHILLGLLLELELAGTLIRHAGGKVSLRYEVE